MNDQSKALTYNAPPGVELRKALVPYDHSATLRALESGIVGKVQQASQVQYARAPESGGPQGQATRPAAIQRNTR